MKFKQARSIIQMSMILRVLRNLKTPKKSWERDCKRISGSL